MRAFNEIYDIAAARKGGAAALEAMVAQHQLKSPDALKAAGWPKCRSSFSERG